MESTIQPQSTAVSSYPNPFNPATTISYQLVEDAHVALEVFDIMGRRVAALVNQEKSAGYYAVQWNGRDALNHSLSSGVYLYRFTATPNGGKESIHFSGKLLLAQ